MREVLTAPQAGGAWAARWCWWSTEVRPPVAANGTMGTDHGSGGAAFVLGGAVRGGRVLADWPGLAPGARYEGRDLRTTTDLRAVFRSVLADHLQVPTARLDQEVFPDSAARAGWTAARLKRRAGAGALPSGAGRGRQLPASGGRAARAGCGQPRLQGGGHARRRSLVRGGEGLRLARPCRPAWRWPCVQRVPATACATRHGGGHVAARAALRRRPAASSAACAKLKVCGPMSSGQPQAAASMRFCPPSGAKLPPSSATSARP
jgi:hypothetical protein